MARLEKDDVLARIGGDQLPGFVASLGHDLRRNGGEHKILCPFHADRKPSLCINHRKKPAGIFKCFSCGWAGDVFQFVGDLQGIQEFPDILRYIGGMLGMATDGRPVKQGEKPVQRERVAPVGPEYMGPNEVLAAYLDYQERAVKPEPWAVVLGVDPAAFPLAGAVNAPYRGADGKVHNEKHIVLAVPMRQPDGTMSSLRFRDYGAVNPKSTGRRWSLDVKAREGDEWVQVRGSRSGLMSTEHVFNPEVCADFQMAVPIEGETDLLGGITIMLRTHGPDPVDWPARFLSLPGVNTCHEQLLKMPMGKLVVTMFDNDEAGRNAVFWHRRWRMVEAPDGTKAREVNLEQPPVPGLLHHLQKLGKDARAAFARKQDGQKFDLRNMAQGGWTWDRVYTHLLENATADPHGRRVKRAI